MATQINSYFAFLSLPFRVLETFTVVDLIMEMVELIYRGNSDPSISCGSDGRVALIIL